jgi:hypothetical protein
LDTPTRQIILPASRIFPWHKICRHPPVGDGVVAVVALYISFLVVIFPIQKQKVLPSQPSHPTTWLATVTSQF